MTTLAVGDIRYVVYPESKPGGPPWVARLRLEGFSPGGRKARWRDLDARGKGLVTFDAADPPPATPAEAISRFQRFQVRSSFFEQDAGADERVRLIVAAEALRGADRGDDDTHQEHGS